MEVSVRLHGVLRDHAGGRHVVPLVLDSDATVACVLDVLAERFPGVERRLRDEAGMLRQHINLFIDAQPVRGTEPAAQRLHDGAEVLFLPAVSGGDR